MPSHPSYPRRRGQANRGGTPLLQVSREHDPLVGAASRRDDGYDDTAGRNTVNRSNG